MRGKNIFFAVYVIFVICDFNSNNSREIYYSVKSLKSPD